MNIKSICMLIVLPFLTLSQLGCDAGIRGKYALITWEEEGDKSYWTSIRSLWPDEKQCAWALYDSEGELKDTRMTCVYVNAIAVMPVPAVGWRGEWPLGYTKYEDRLGDFSIGHLPQALNHPQVNASENE